MIRFVTAVSLLALLSACGDGQPLFDEEGNLVAGGGGDAVDGSGEGEGDGGDGDGVDGDVALPPGTANPSRSAGIVRFEARNDIGGGYAQEFAYNASNDTFEVDNLAFDGFNVYQRGEEIPTLGGYAVYDGAEQVEDSLTGNPINQVVPYRAILGLSENRADDERRTTFAVVRTGGYNTYGFGGFVYERNGNVVLPDEGQAGFTGSYAGLRVYTNRGGLDYTQGDIEVAVDFDDFNANDAVLGRIFNRQAFDENGVPVTNLALPELNFSVVEGESVLNGTGEISGPINSYITLGTGERELYEDGEYYGIIAGDTTDPSDGGEIVGVIVVESEDRRYEEVLVQETGGFIVCRD